MRLLIATGSVVLALLVTGAPASAAGLVPPEPVAPVNYLPPSIAGSAAEGSTVTCTPGYWLNSPASYVFAWQRNATTTVSGPSSNPGYTLTSGDVGQVITCTVTATNAYGSGSAISIPVTPVTAPAGAVPINESPPAITGDPEAGQTVGCSPGAWLNAPTQYLYTWQRNGLNLSGQTGGSYELTGADVNQLITCQVVSSNSSGDSPPAVSPPVLPSAATSGPGTGGSPGGGGSAGGSGGGSNAGGPAGGGTARLASGPAPTLGVFSVSPRQMSVRGRGRRAHSAGLTFRYSLDRQARVLIVIERRASGRRVGRACAAVTRATTRHAPCIRFVVVTRLIIPSAQAGAGRAKYSGRAGAAWLARGAYSAVAAAQTLGGWSKSRTAAFTVVWKR